MRSCYLRHEATTFAVASNSTVMQLITEISPWTQKIRLRLFLSGQKLAPNRKCKCLASAESLHRRTPALQTTAAAKFFLQAVFVRALLAQRRNLAARFAACLLISENVSLNLYFSVMSHCSGWRCSNQLTGCLVRPTLSKVHRKKACHLHTV